MTNNIEQIQKYLTKTQNILLELERFDTDVSIVTVKGISTVVPNLELEFKHLVYKYDSKLPLNSHLQEVRFKHGYSPSFHMLKSYVEIVKFFVKYLNEEIEELQNTDK